MTKNSVITRKRGKMATTIEIIDVINSILVCAILGLWGAIQYLKYKRLREEKKTNKSKEREE